MDFDFVAFVVAVEESATLLRQLKFNKFWILTAWNFNNKLACLEFITFDSVGYLRSNLPTISKDIL